jgi:aminoglycoside phosphotransferase (APT) family kinase protein
VLRVMRNPEALPAAKLEAAALVAAAAAGCAVPRFGELTSYEGRPAIVMQRINGPDLLSDVGRRPWTVLEVGKTMGRIHAEMHRVLGPSELPVLKEVLRSRIEMAPELPDSLKSFALAQLRTLPNGDALCHGDFYPGNILEGEGGPMVIDWINATRGDPDADVARTRLLLGMGRPPPGSSRLLLGLAVVGRGLLLSRYMRSYKRSTDRLLRTERWEPVLAAARMSEGIVEEFPGLIELVERARARASASKP